jgi:hypothetical protein
MRDTQWEYSDYPSIDLKRDLKNAPLFKYLKVIEAGTLMFPCKDTSKSHEFISSESTIWKITNRHPNSEYGQANTGFTKRDIVVLSGDLFMKGAFRYGKRQLDVLRALGNSAHESWQHTIKDSDLKDEYGNLKHDACIALKFFMLYTKKRRDEYKFPYNAYFSEFTGRAIDAIDFTSISPALNGIIINENDVEHGSPLEHYCEYERKRVPSKRIKR